MAKENKNREVVGIVTAKLMRKNQKEVLGVWMENQLANITLRPNLLSQEDLEGESQRFLDAFIKTISGGNLEDVSRPEYETIKKMLEDISTSRALKGFTPSETATYVFSLKDAILTFLQKEYQDDPNVLNREVVSISQLIDKLGLVSFETYAQSREEVISKQASMMIEVATPVLTIWRKILLLPIVGAIDTKRAQVIMSALLRKILETESKVAILDILGVLTVDSAVAAHIVKIARASKLMGCDCLVSGISPAVAQTLVHLGIELGNIITITSLADALSFAFESLDIEVGERKEILKKKRV